MIILRQKLYAKPSIGGEDIYFRDSFFYKNTPQKEQEDERILKLLRDLNSRGYLNQHGKDYLKTANHRDTVHIASYMLTDEGEDIMERYGDVLEIGTKNSISLEQIDKNGLVTGYKKKLPNYKEKQEKQEKAWERQAKAAERKLEEDRNLYKYLKESNPKIKNLEEINKELLKNNEWIYDSLRSLDETETPLLEDITWANENRKNKDLYALYSIGGLNIYYDKKKNTFAEEVSYNNGNIKTKPISNVKSRILEYLKSNKKRLIQNSYQGLSEWGEVSSKDKKAIEAFVDKEIQLIQSKL